MKETKRLVLLAMLTAVAMILSYVESLLPSVGIPGVKMGLANIAVIFALFRFGWKEAAALSLVRVVLVSLLFGSVGAMLYSLAGAVLSLAVMALLLVLLTMQYVRIRGIISRTTGDPFARRPHYK